MAHISFFPEITGKEFSDLIAAEVILFRLASWFLPTVPAPAPTAEGPEPMCWSFPKGL
jgi:hypothetical protein